MMRSDMHPWLRSIFIVLSCVIPSSGPVAAVPRWMSAESHPASTEMARIRGGFDVQAPIESGELRAVADFCEAQVHVNGRFVGELESFSPVSRFDITPHLRHGRNVIAIAAANEDGPSAVFVHVKIRRPEGQIDEYVSDGSWRRAPATADASGWETVDFAHSDWAPVIDRGPVHLDFWDLDGDGIQVGAFDDYEQWQDAKATSESTAAAMFRLPPGFVIERLRSALPEEDSWIAMAIDDRGRIIVAREVQGLLRMTLPEGEGEPLRVEVINEDVAEVRGMVAAGDSIFLNSNRHNLRREPRDRTGGLVRLRDTTGDDRFDEVTWLGERTDTGGHGRNDLTLGPDGMLYLIGGDSVSVPTNAVNLVPSVPSILPGDALPHGHVIRTDFEGKVFEVVCQGLRNPYGIDFNRHGEMFTYDADAEFDMGAPWYRPTRILHLVSGADYGWRRVTGRWPPYDPDHHDGPPWTLDIGKGSPISVKFGTRSRFPERFRRALFVLDWTYGRIFVVHVTPRGASYACRPEVFLRGRPANVTDLEFGPDGALATINDPSQRKRFAGWFDESPPPLIDVTALMASRRFVREWAVSDFGKVLDDRAPRDLDNGKQMFTAAACVLCHRLGDQGRMFGPDLTDAAARFGRRDLLEAILDPSKGLDEKYANVTIETVDGDVHTGRIVLRGDFRTSVLKLVPHPFEPDKVLEIPKANIRAHRVSSVSSMPSGLLNTLTREDILDLLAYIESGGRVPVNRRTRPGRGLLTIGVQELKNYIANQHERRNAVKRGGGTIHVPMEGPKNSAEIHETGCLLDQKGSSWPLLQEPVDAQGPVHERQRLPDSDPGDDRHRRGRPGASGGQGHRTPGARSRRGDHSNCEGRGTVRQPAAQTPLHHIWISHDILQGQPGGTIHEPLRYNAESNFFFPTFWIKNIEGEERIGRIQLHGVQQFVIECPTDQ